MKKGVVFESNERAVSEIKVADILAVARPLGIWMKKVGIGMVVLATLGMYWVYEPLLNYEIKYQKARSKNANETVNIQDTKPQNSKDSKINYEYKIYIPKIGAEAKVIANVDPFDKKAYSKALLEGVAEAKGLSHPGESGTTYLFAHSVGNRIDFARYNAIFYLLNKLERGDDVYIDYEGKNYKYKVVQKAVLEARDLKYMEKQTEEERLVLQTCYPPGTSWKRLLVVAHPDY